MEIRNVLFEVHGLFEMLDLGARVVFSSRLPTRRAIDTSPGTKLVGIVL